MVYESNWIIGAWKAAIISRSGVVCAMLQSGGLSVCWLHKEQGKSEEHKQNKMLPAAATPVWTMTGKVCNVRTYVWMDVYKYICTYVSMYGCIYICCMHVCMNVCVYNYDMPL